MENVTHVNVTQDAQNQEFEQLSPGVRTFAAIVMGVSMVMGLTGNLLTVLALLKYPKVRNAGTTFTICLCIANFVFCGSVHPFDISNLWWWTHGGISCKIIPFLRYGNLSVSMLCIGLITVNRYVLIVRRSWYECAYRKHKVAVMIAFSWVFSYAILLPTLFGVWGKFDHDTELGFLCSIVPDENGRSAETALFIIAIVNAILIVICYTRIICFVQKSKRRLREHQRSQHDTPGTLNSDQESTTKHTRETNARRNEWKMTKMVLATFLSFLVCYLPITIAKVARLHSPTWQIAGYILLYASTGINPIIYGVMNTQYRDAYVALLGRPQSRPRRSGLSSEARPTEGLESRRTKTTKF